MEWDSKELKNAFLFWTCQIYNNFVRVVSTVCVLCIASMI